jgi:hypothetical protein
MDRNNNHNQPRQPNPNQFRGRAVPPEERVGQLRQCRRCHDWFVNILRHERNCTGDAKPYKCNQCQKGYNKELLVRRHFMANHPNIPLPPDFLNPDYRHRRANQQNDAPAGPPPPPPQAAQNANPPQGEQDVPAGGEPEEPVPGPAPRPVPPMAQPAAGGEGRVPPAPRAAPRAAFGGGIGAAPGQAPAPPPRERNAGWYGARLPPLLRYNLAANILQAREAFGGDELSVIIFVNAVMRHPAQFQLPG